MVAAVCCPGTWELEAGGVEIQGHPQLTAFTTKKKNPVSKADREGKVEWREGKMKEEVGEIQKEDAGLNDNS